MTFKPIKVMDVELSKPLADIVVQSHYSQARCLVRWCGTPVGTITVTLTDGRATTAKLGQQIEEELGTNLIQLLCWQRLAAPIPSNGLSAAELIADVAAPLEERPLVTVAVCTRNRTDDLRQCLTALAQLDYPHLDFLIVDNAPSNEATRQLVETVYPQMRYVCEPRPGLNWARNRAILAARGDIIAYTDDDVIVDPQWVTALVRTFMDNPSVMAVTGLVVPHELETEAEQMFECYGGFGRGYVRQWAHVEHSSGWRWMHYGTGRYGTGANMAYRREVFTHIGPFDPALDVGTVTNGGGDLEMFFRVLQEGYTLVYEPTAVVRHRHRREMDKLYEQFANNGIGFASYAVRAWSHYPGERVPFLKLALWWILFWCIGRLLGAFRPDALPHGLVMPEIIGSLKGLGRYQKASRRAAEIADEFGPQPFRPPVPHPSKKKRAASRSIAVRTVDLTLPLVDLDDIENYSTVRLFVTCGSRMVGHVDVTNNFRPLTPMQLRQVVAEQFSVQLLNLEKSEMTLTSVPEIVQRSVHRHFAEQNYNLFAPLPQLPATVSASVVIATLDRPQALRTCLSYLLAQQTERPLEIVIVDNNPASGLTPPVVAEFPNVVLVSEPRRGLAYARNAGFAACTGAIAIATDDDVEVPPHWLESLIAPFARPEVMAVTGNVLPKQLENLAQQSFEIYGGLGRGYKRFEADGAWFRGYSLYSVPTWTLGATANAAFRTSVFHHKEIGLMHEALGPGMPSGVGEDTYLFYKILRAGYTIAYEPSAYVWHKHRDTMKALRKQLFDYSKGHIAYHLTTLLRDGDGRALLRIFVHLPRWRATQVAMHLYDFVSGRLFRGRGHYPLALTAIEIWGNVVGPWALWKSHQRVRREGNSPPYIPLPQRATTAANQMPIGVIGDREWVEEKAAV